MMDKIAANVIEDLITGMEKARLDYETEYLPLIEAAKSLLETVEPKEGKAKKGHWEFLPEIDSNEKRFWWRCSECEKIVGEGLDIMIPTDFCPSCGAEMADDNAHYTTGDSMMRALGYRKTIDNGSLLRYEKPDPQKWRLVISVYRISGQCMKQYAYKGDTLFKDALEFDEILALKQIVEEERKNEQKQDDATKS